MKCLCVILLLITAGGIFALDGAFAGLGPELNADTRDGVALGGALQIGLDFERPFALGLKTGFFYNFDTVTALEMLSFFRYYFPLKFQGPFVQTELGAVIFYEFKKAYPAFIGGLALGWRVNLGRLLYLEPSIRGGYPFAWGAGLMIGPRFGRGKK